MSDRLTVHFDDMLHTFREVTRPDAPNAVEDDGDVAIYTVRESMRTYGVEFQFREPVQLNIQSCEGFSVTIDRSDGLRCRILQTMLGEDQLFDTFMKDLMELIVRTSGDNVQARASALERRAESWRVFMHTVEKVLSPEKERGLFGELIVLERLLKRGVDKPLADIWTGPMRNEHDFILSAAEALEVKTSSSKLPFVPKIDNIMQLDSTDRNDLLLVAVHLSEDPEGVTLAELTSRVSLLLSNSDREELRNLMLVQKIDLENPGRELNRFSVEFVRAFRADSLPRITRASNPEILDATYRFALIDDQGEALQGAEEIIGYLDESEEGTTAFDQ